VEAKREVVGQPGPSQFLESVGVEDDQRGHPLVGLQGDDQDEELTAKEIAEEIRDEGTSTYIKTINNGAKRVFDRNRVEAEFEVGSRRSKQVKSLILPELDDGVI